MKITTRSRFIREEGSALIAVIMLMTVVGALVIGSVQVARHANDSTSVDRERLQTIEAAEAGVNEAIRRIEVAPNVASVCTGIIDPARTELKDGDRLLGQYLTKIKPDASVPPDPNTCVIESWGFAPTGGTRAMRHLEVAVKLVPQSGFPYTLFAEGSAGSIYVKNSGAIGGDAYAETLDQSKNNLAAQDIVTPGSIVTKNNAAYSGTLWAGGDVTLGNGSNVGQSVLASGTAPSSSGNVAIGSGGVIGGDVLAAANVTNNGTVNGTVSAHDLNVPPPPNLVKPTFDEDAVAYTYTNGNASTFNSYLSTNANNLQGVLRYNGTGTIVIPDNVTVTGPLTIVSSGKIDLGQTMSISGGPHVVAFIALSTAADAIDFPKSFTGASGLHVLMYTLGGVDGRNNSTFTGSIYADFIDFKNTFNIHKSDLLETNGPTGFTWDFTSSTTYTIVPTLWSEVAPGAPPD